MHYALTETHVVAIVSLGCIVHQHCLNRYDFNLCLKTGELREGSLKTPAEDSPRSGEASWPNRFCFCSWHKKIASHRQPKTGEGWNSWFQYKHLHEVYRSDTMETLVNEKTQLEVDSWRMGNQWRWSLMSAEIGSNLRFRRTRRAATRTTVCSWSIKPSPIPAKRLLQ